MKYHHTYLQLAIAAPAAALGLDALALLTVGIASVSFLIVYIWGEE